MDETLMSRKRPLTQLATGVLDLRRVPKLIQFLGVNARFA
jgi:hypothetical protein